MNFVLNLVWREMRSSWRRLLFFFICISIGVGSIVALRSITQDFNHSVTSNAREFMTGDVELSSTSPASVENTRIIEEILAQNNAVEAQSKTIQTNVMARSKGGTQFVEVKGVDENFPLVGKFALIDGKTYDYSLLDNFGAIVAPLLLEKLSLQIGDKIRIGEQNFEIRAAIENDPGDVSGVRLGPRVFISKKDYEAAGLLSFGARNRFRTVYRVKDAYAVEPLVESFRARLKNTLIQPRSYREVQEQVGENLSRVEDFLALTGLIVLLLGGLGVWNVTRVFIEQKKRPIAVLKCLGASSRQISLAYLFQILSLGFFGSLFGITLARIALYLVQLRFADALPAGMTYKLQPNAIFQGLALGLLISALFSGLPLLRVTRIRPNLLLRDEANESISRLNPLSLAVGVLSVGGLFLLSVWQAGSWKVGAYFLGGLALTTTILFGASNILVKLLHKIRAYGSFSFRQAVGSLSRPGNQTRVVLLAVGLGAFVILAVNSLRTNLIREFDVRRDDSIPSIVLLDIQRRQVEQVKQILRDTADIETELLPVVRARIAAIDGKQIDFQQTEVRQERGLLGREYNITYRPNLIGKEKILEGEFWNAEPSAEAEVSVDKSLKGIMGLQIGSVMTFDILGVKINARVTSIREIDTKNPRSVFLIVFRPGTLETAPQTFISPITAKLNAETRARLQNTLVETYPNISVIDTTDALNSVRTLIDNIVIAVTFVGFFVMLSGILILIGSIALTKFQRIYENALLKTLGAKRATLGTILLAEYGVLGAVAALIGTTAAYILSFIVAKYILKIEWQFDFLQALTGFTLTVLSVMIVGTISSFDVLFKKPLAVLRSQ